MSSDEDTPSLDKDKCLPHSPITGGLRRRFRFLRHKTDHEEGHVRIKDLSKLYNINSGQADHVLPTEDTDEVESAIDALEDEDLKDDGVKNATNTLTNEEVRTLKFPYFFVIGRFGCLNFYLQAFCWLI